MQRRTFLRSVVAATGVATAGCSLDSRPDGTATPDPEQRTLDRVRLSHSSSDAKRVSLLITRDGSTVYWQTLELPSADGQRTRQSLTVEPPEYERARGVHHVYVRSLTDGVRNDIAIAELSTEECYLLNARVTTDSIGFSQSLNMERC
ncbi:hypothetical protein [Haloglomus salinum]|jgi:hypothetical protein|uniref:hypothetical protein n=1 Tax=Haloglomus salinum TaxID=2962673 RepID=UPI0020CA105E|nr:hypothetical protein [Haloglomus salinum]